MQNTIIKREVFKKALRQEIKDLFRTTLEEATPRQIYQAVCQKCGVTFDVPFPPREGHRILCPDCFEKEHKK